jgi:signal transduction histidine kinase
MGFKDAETTGRSPIPGAWARTSLLGAMVFAGLFVASRYNYLLFHSLAEIFSIVVACAIFMLAWNSRRVLENDYFLFLGIVYLFVGALDFFHMLAYKGMGVFTGYDANLPTQLWISARYVESISLLIAPFFVRGRFNRAMAFIAYAGITALLLLGIFYWHVFPDCFLEDTGLTPFKKISEYAISLIFLTAAVFLARRREAFDRDVFRFLILSIFASIGAELSFTFYSDVFGLANLAGHFLKIVSFALIYKAVIETGVVRPQAVLFRDLKQTEEALRRSRDELELRVQERTGQLRKYAARLEWRNRELQDFSYIASHDLQEPLRKVQMFGDMLQIEVGDALSGKPKDYLARMIRSAKRTQTLVKDLLDYSRVSMKAEPFSMVDLNEAIGQALGNLEANTRQLGARINVGDLPRIEADSMQMIQLFQNLVGNALKFCPEGQAPEIAIFAGQPETSRNSTDGFCEIRIRDHGIGFDEQYLDQIFKPFERLHGRQEYEGTGIGLAICKKIVERHGGSITAQSTPGRGSTFIVALPVVQEGNTVNGY